MTLSGSLSPSGPSRKSKFRSRRTADEPAPAGEVAAAVEPAETLPEAERPPGWTPALRAEPAPPENRGWPIWLLAPLLLAAGGVAGYFLHGSVARPGNRPAEATPSPAVQPVALAPEVQARLDAAYAEGRSGHFQKAAELFAALHQQHPEWPKLRLEAARYSIYSQDYIAARGALAAAGNEGPAWQAEQDFLTGVLNLKLKDYAGAEQAFAAVVALDPTRSEYYFLWGECLRQDGKPREAEACFRSALSRNQFETAEDFLLLKVWVCSLATDQETADGTNAAIDEAMAQPFPRSAALLGAAARSLKANRAAEAAAFLTRARAAMDQTVFRVLLQDPAFMQESWRPELAQFYPEKHAAPNHL